MRSILLSVGLMMILMPIVAHAGEPIVLQAISDFEIVSGIEGQAEAYIHEGKNALAINAAEYKGMTASAKTVYKGADQYFDVTLVALLETDGESSYTLTVNGHKMSEVKQNISTNKDYLPYQHVWKGVRINRNNVIEVGFNTHTNGKIPEGDGTAYSRGRWTQLLLTPAAMDTDAQLENVVHFDEADGLVVMEAEATHSNLGLWVLKKDTPDYSGKGHLEFTGNNHNGGPPKSPLVYTFTIHKPGDYQLHIRARKRLEGQSSDKCNDGYVCVKGDYTAGANGAPLEVLQANNKIFGGAANGWGWCSKLDANHHKYDAMYHFNAGETYTLIVAGRSVRWNIDGIVFRHVSVDVDRIDDVFTQGHRESLPSGAMVLKAVKDFDLVTGGKGDVEAYIDEGEGALAINAAKYKDRFAAAETVFDGESQYYDITLVALLETDGESSYKLSVDGRDIGQPRQNAPTPEDYVPYRHVWKGVRINQKNVIKIAFNSHTNGRIPEGDTTAYSRGRWTKLILTPAALDREPQLDTAVLFAEADGLVVMEAESTQSDLGHWVLKTDNPQYTGRGHLEFTSNNQHGGPPKSPLVYRFTIHQAGDYQLHLRARKRLDGEPGDKCNDGYVQVIGDYSSGRNGAKLEILSQLNKLFGGPASGWGWASKLDAHGKHNPIYRFKAGETYMLILAGRAIRWNIDRIVFRHVSVDVARINSASESTKVVGRMERWRPVTISFPGPQVDEVSRTFRDYRLDVTFTKGKRSLVVPGFFAADGMAGHTNAAKGKCWKVVFTPDETGTWTYRASFRTGKDIAISRDPEAGQALAFDGTEGAFLVRSVPCDAKGFYAQGMLRYVGEHYLQFAGTGEMFVKAGPGGPENFLGYVDFDGTYNVPGGINDEFLGEDRLHHYAPHVKDWRPSDPTWGEGKGKAIIGTVNYMADLGLNSLYIVTNNVNGDGRDCWPWTDYKARDVYDVSKLAQWRMVFEHMMERGVALDFYLWESENTRLLNNGDMGIERSIYYREMVARFGHLLALRWNISEEPTMSPEKVLTNCAYIKSIDPYQHAVGAHCSHKKEDRDLQYEPQLGSDQFDGAWMQIHKDHHNEVLQWVSRSRAAGWPWVVSVDESLAISVNDNQKIRCIFWETVMAGGEGVEVYFGYGGGTCDICNEDYRNRHTMWEQLAHGIDFFRIPEVNRALRLMRNHNDLGSGRVLANPGQVYVLYVDGEEARLDLRGQAGQYKVRWFNPITGKNLQMGSVTTIAGGRQVDLGRPPSKSDEWVILVTRIHGKAVSGYDQ